MMEHSEFIDSWNQGKLIVDVHRTKALQIVNSNILPKRYLIAHLFWSWIWILTIPVSIIVMFVYKWWVGLLILIFVTPSISSATKKSAMQFIIDNALENRDFYKFAVVEGLLIIRKKP